MVDAVPVVLASGSPRRRALLGRLGLEPQVRVPDVDERAHSDEAPLALVRRLAATKVDAVDADPEELVVAADTVVVLDGRSLGKPRDREHAAAILQALSGHTHEVLTAVAVRFRGLDAIGHEATLVSFRSLTDREIAWYLTTGEPDDKAGAYALQGAGAALVDRIAGSDTNVIGLPLALTVALAREVGVDLLTSGGPTSTHADA